MEPLLGVSQTPFVLRTGQDKQAGFFILKLKTQVLGPGSWVTCGIEMKSGELQRVFAEPRGTVGLTTARV